MNKKVKSTLIDILIGLIVFAISTLTFSQSDSLLIFYLVAIISVLSASVYRGIYNTLTPYITFCLINVGIVFLFLDTSIKSETIYLLTLLPILFISAIGLYLGGKWRVLSLVQRVTAFTVSGLVGYLFYLSMINPISNIIFIKSSNDDFPAFDITLQSGQIISTDSLKDKVVVLNYGKINDNKSHFNLARMESVFKKFQEHPEVEQLFLSTAIVGESLDKLKSRTEKYWDLNKIDTPFAYNVEGSQHYFRTYTLPTIVIIDKKGKVRIKRAGYFTERDVAEQTIQDIQFLLGE